MGGYASNTSVSVDRSLVEIEKVLQRAGAGRFAMTKDYESGRCAVAFEVGRLPFRLEIPLPDRDSVDFTKTHLGRPRAKHLISEAYDKEVRRRYRVMLIAIKAKVELVATGCSSWEREFMAQLMLPSGKTVAEAFLPKLDKALADGEMPRLLMPPVGGG